MPSALDALDVRLPAAGWAVLDAVRARAFTGELTLIGSPAVRIWADRGRIYLAERFGAPPLAARLIAAGLLTPADVARGAVLLDGREHLGALFERVPTVDRHAIQLAVGNITAEALQTIAGQQLAGGEVVPYAFDPSGVHAWSEVALPGPALPAPSPVAPPSAVAPPVAAAPPPAEPAPPAPPVPATASPTLPPPPTPPPSPPPPAPPTVVAADPPQPDTGAPLAAGVTAVAAEAAEAAVVAVAADLATDEGEARADAFSVIWPDGDVERRSGSNGLYGREAHESPLLAGVSAGVRTRILDDRFGAA